MDIKRSINKRINKLFRKDNKSASTRINNLYKTNYERSVLISYITAPFRVENHFTHQNYVTSHLVAESFSQLGYNVDIVDYFDADEIDYGQYAVIFGFGSKFERSFYSSNYKIKRILFVTGAHEALQNSMSLKSVEDFSKLSGKWLAGEANVITNSTYYSMYCSDVIIVLAQGFVFDDFKSRFINKLYSLNNNIIGIFNDFKPKTVETRTKSFLYLTGGTQLSKGLSILLEVAKIRRDLKFYIVVMYIGVELEMYYEDLLHNSSNIFLIKNIRMDSGQMREIVEECSYIIAPSYTDGLPGGTIEPMSAGLIPIVSKYCGFAREKFIFEMEELSSICLNETIDRVLGMDGVDYLDCSKAVKHYARDNFSPVKVKNALEKILEAELSIQVYK